MLYKSNIIFKINIKIAMAVFVLLVVSNIFLSFVAFAIPRDSNSNINSPDINLHELIDIGSHNELDYLPNVILIKTKKMSSVDKLNNITLESSIISKLENIGLTIKKIRAPFINHYYKNGLMSNSSNRGIERICEITIDTENNNNINNINILEICKELSQDENIEYAEPAPVRNVYSFNPNDPLKTNQWYLSAIGAYEAWDIVKNKQGVLIGIVDSGTDINHEDLKSNIWKNPNEKIDALDNDNNGKIDDINGWDFVGNVSIQDIANGKYKEDNNPCPTSSANSHGTHVAGCAAAVTNNNIGVAGIGLNCKIVATKHSIDNNHLAGIHRGYEGVVYLAKLGARVINCSWGGSRFSFAELDAINEAIDLGAVIFAASGNEYKDNNIIAAYPACYKGVISVGSTAIGNTRSNFSNYGYSTLLHSYGSKIYSTVPFDAYNNFDGTSMASPIAAGVAGLVLSVFPEYNYKQVYHQMRSTGSKISLSSTQDTFKYANRIVASNAVKYNNPDFPELVVPGVEVIEYKLSPFEKFTNTSQKKLTLKFKNYIGKAKNLRVSIQSIDNYVLFTGNKNTIELEIGAMDILEETEVLINAKLSEQATFVEGAAGLLVKYFDGDFSDYEVIYIPISVPTNNNISRNILYGAHDNGYPAVNYGTLVNYNPNAAYLVRSFYDAYNTFRAVLDIIPYNSDYSSMQYFSTPQQSVPYAMSVLSSSHFIIGTSTSSKAFVLNTKDLFNTSKYLEVTNLTSFVNYISFFDDRNGIFIGDPAANSKKWGIAKTSDGGTTWTAISGGTSSNSGAISDAISGENGLLNVASQHKNNIWFGTTRGRIFRSADRGATWAVDTISIGDAVIALSFANADTGMAICNSSGTYFLATTTDNTHWVKNTAKNFNFTQSVPQSIYSDEHGTFYIIFSNNAILSSGDLGRTWKMQPSKELSNAKYSGVVQSADKKSLMVKTLGATSQYNSITPNFYCSYYTVTNTKIDIPDPKSESSIVAIPQSELRYGVVELGKDSTRYILIKNTGTKTVVLNNFTIIPENQETSSADFTLARYVSSIAPGDSGRIYIRFTPKTSGNKQAVIYISNNTDKYPELGFRLTGTASFTPFAELKSNKQILEWEYNSEDSFIPEQILYLTNIGNTPVTISNFSILPTNQNTNTTDFEVLSLEEKLPLDIGAGQTEKIRIKFAGDFSTDVSRTAELVLHNSGVTPEYKINLVFNSSGNIFCTDGLKFDFNIFKPICPNPATNEYEINFILSATQEYLLELYNSKGDKLSTIFSGLGSIGENKIIANTGYLSAGCYYLLLKLRDEHLWNQLIIAK